MSSNPSRSPPRMPPCRRSATSTSPRAECAGTRGRLTLRTRHVPVATRHQPTNGLGALDRLAVRVRVHPAARDRCPTRRGRWRGLDSKAVAILGLPAGIGAVRRRHGRTRDRVVPADPRRSRVRRGVRLRARMHDPVRVSPAHRRRRPWLPFRMLAAAWVGAGAGALPSGLGRLEVPLLAVYGACRPSPTGS